MIKAASKLLRRDGYAATGLRAVVAEAGTSWGSAHHCFPGGKEELAVEAMRYGGARVSDALERALREGADVADGVHLWFSRAGSTLQRSGYEGGCPIATVALEVSPGVVGVAKECSTQIKQWTSRLAQALVDEQVPIERASELATVVVSCLEGALLVARVTRESSVLERTGSQMATFLRCSQAASR